MGNDVLCRVASIRTMRVRVHDGVARTLFDVCHVAEVTKNLISLCILDSKGYRCVIENDKFNVAKGTVAAIVGKQVGTLYELIGITIKGTVRTTLRACDSCVVRLGLI